MSVIKHYISLVTAVFVISPLLYGATTILPTQNQVDETDKNYDRRQQELLEYQRQQREQFLEKEIKKIEVPEQPTRSSNLGMVEGVICFELEKIILEDAGDLPKSKKEEILSPYYHKCVKSAEINKLIADITNWYIDKDYVSARVYLPEQNIKTGTLILKVMIGRLDQIKQNKNRSVDQMEVLPAFPTSKGRKLNIRDIEQGLDQLNRLPSNSAQTQILPGSEVGTSTIQVNNTQEDRLRGYVEATNGLNSKGEPKLNFRVEKDNLFHLSDQVQYSYGTGVAQSNEAVDRSQNVSFSLPLGYWTLKPSYAYYRSLTNLNILGVNYPYESTNNNYNLYSDYVLYRWKAALLTLTGGLVYKDRKTSFSGELLDALSRRTSDVELGIGFTNRYSSGYYDFRFTIAQGTKFFGSKPDDTQESGPEYPKAQARKYLIDGSLCHYLAGGLRFCSNGRIQLSNATLYSEEQLGVGDRYTVRGFNKGFFLGDDGFYIRNELSLPFPYKGQNAFVRAVWSPEIFTGLDFGYASKKGGASLYGNQYRAFLSGLAFGVRNNAKYFNLGVTLGVPIAQPRFIWELESNNVELYINLAIKAF